MPLRRAADGASYIEVSRAAAAYNIALILWTDKARKVPSFKRAQVLASLDADTMTESATTISI